MKNVARWMVCMALAAACVEQPAANNNNNRGVSSQELEAVRRRVASRTAPTNIQNPLNFTFGDNKVQLLGYEINQTELRPGQSVTVTFFWKCNTALGDGWRLFTHLDDINGPRTNQDNVGDVRRAYQPERWRAGEFVRDTQTFELPQEWDSPTVRIHVGFWKDAERLPATPADRTDGQRRARVIELRTGVQLPVSEMPVGRATGTITTDGRFDEPAWANAARTGPLVNTMTGAPAGATEASATARLLWDDQNLYVGFEVRDDNLVDPSTAHDNHLWEHDTVEIMIDPDGDSQNYYELQISPRNHTFDTRYDRPHDPVTRTPGQPERFGHEDYNPELRTGVVATGTIGNTDDTDTGYNVEVAIPWASINQGLAHNPPQPGDTVRLNLYVMDEPKSGGQRAAAWSAPRRGDFHALERFGRITLAPATPGNEPTAVPPTAPTGGPAAAVPAPPPGTPLEPTAIAGPAGANTVRLNNGMIIPAVIPANRAPGTPGGPVPRAAAPAPAH